MGWDRMGSDRMGWDGMGWDRIGSGLAGSGWVMSGRFGSDRMGSTAMQSDLITNHFCDATYRSTSGILGIIDSYFDASVEYLSLMCSFRWHDKEVRGPRD